VKKYRLHDSVFDRLIYLCVGKPTGKLAQDVKATFYGQFAHYEVEGGRTEYYIWIREWKNTPFWVCTLVHEVFHYVAHTMTHLGIPFADESDEAWAYYLDSLVKQSLMKLSNRPEGR